MVRVKDSEFKVVESLCPQDIRPKTYQEYRNFWQKAEKISFLSSFPLHLDIELTNICNLKCKMCWQHELLNYKKGFMTEELFKKIIDEGINNGLSAIKLQIRGESTLHPQLIDFIKYAKKSGILDVQLTTNGILLANDKNLQEMLSSGLDKLIISLDDEHDKSAKEIFGENAPKIDLVVKKTIELRQKMFLKRPLVRLQTHTKEDQLIQDRFQEIQELYPNVDEYNISNIFNFKDDEDGIIGLHEDYEMLPCTYPWTRMAIYWDGEVTACCRDYNNRFDLGNVMTMNIKDIWLGKKMMMLREKHLNNQRKDLSICRHCQECVESKKKSEKKDVIIKNKA